MRKRFNAELRQDSVAGFWKSSKSSNGGKDLIMKKLLALAVIATALVVSSAASAATVVNVVKQGATDIWEISVATTAGEQVGGIALLGNLSMLNLTFNAANPGVSPADSGLVPDVLGDGTTNAMSINNTAIGVSIGSGPGTGVPGPGQYGTLLGTLTIAGSGPNPGDVRGGDELYGYTALDQNGVTIVGATVNVVGPAPAPEPAAMLLLGVGLAGLALIRRKA